MVPAFTIALMEEGKGVLPAVRQMAEMVGRLSILLIPSAFFLPPIRVTFHAVLKIGDILLPMLRSDLSFVVFMAAITGIGFIPCGVAGGAGYRASLPVIQWKGMFSIKCGGYPGGGRVTRRAVYAELPRVFTGFGMAVYADGWRAFEDSVLMAVFAADLHVRPGQWEAGLGMVKSCAIPTLRGMAGSAIRAELALVFIVLLMTGEAVGGRAFENVVGMALFTWHAGMFAFQFEG